MDIAQVFRHRLVAAAVLVCWCGPVYGQFLGDWAWRPLLEYEGVVFSYIFYPEGDGSNNGVVLMLRNTNDYPVEVKFKVIFRAEDDTHIEVVEKMLGPGEAKTGGTDKLFWVPWKDGRTIAELGLRGYEVIRRDLPARSGT